jgi:PAS domain S-box-containing protein
MKYYDKTKNNLIEKIKLLEQQLAKLKYSTDKIRTQPEIKNNEDNKNSPHLYKEIFKTYDKGITILKPIDDGKNFIVIDINEAGGTFNNVELKDVLGKSILELFPQSKELGIYEVIKRVYDTGKTEKKTLNYTTKDKLARCIEFEVFRLSNKEIVCIYSDISSKKDIEQRLSLLATAVEQSPSEVAITDKDGRLEYVNPKFTELTGYSINEAIGQNPSLLKSGEQDPEFYKNLWERIKNGEEWTGNFSNKKKNGEIYWEYAKIAPVKDANDNITHYIKVAEDITERKKAEEKLEKSYYTLTTAMDSIGAGIYVADMNTYEIIFANKYLKDFYGGDIIGKTCWQVFYDKKDSVCNFCSNRRLLTPDNKPAGEFIWEYPEPTSGKYFSVNDKAIYWIDGRIMRISILTDITKRKIAEDGLKSKNQELKQFAYSLSHDLKNPLIVIISYVNVLRREYSKYFDKEIDEMTGKIMNRAKDMSKMIDSLLYYSRIENSEDSFTICDLKNIVKTAIDNLELEIKKKSAKITKDPLPKVTGDEIQLVLLYQNLISNALKYCRNKTPKIHLSSKLAKDSESYILSVKDNGIGIDEESKGIIFLIFKRLHKDNKEYEGTGIGLSTCKKIIERHNGKIWVESEPGKGSTFYFTLRKA